MLLSFWNQLKKQLKKKLRWRRRWLNLAVVLFAAGVVSAWIWLAGGRDERQDQWNLREQSVFGRHMTEQARQPEEEVLKLIQGIEGSRDAYSKKAYVCGEELLLIGSMSSGDILAYYKKHPELTVSLDDGGKVFFTEKVEDLSPQCKDNAYFGLDAGGNLSLFEGIPGTSGSNVIRTFFQLNIEHLESSLPRETVKQLYRGIRVSDLADYNSVLSTLSDYAVEETEKAMKTSPQH